MHILQRCDYRLSVNYKCILKNVLTYLRNSITGARLLA